MLPESSVLHITHTRKYLIIQLLPLYSVNSDIFSVKVISDETVIPVILLLNTVFNTCVKPD